MGRILGINLKLQEMFEFYKRISCESFRSFKEKFFERLNKNFIESIITPNTIIIENAY